MKMADLKLPKRTEDELKGIPEKAIERERWPYGMRLTFESEQVDKIPYLEKVKVGQKLMIEGIGEVTSIRMNEEKDGKKKYSVEVQLHEVGCEGKGKPESMGEAMGRSWENHKL